MRRMRLKTALFAAAVALLVAPLAAQPPTVRIHAATVLDGTGKTLRDTTIVVQGSKITSIETGGAANATYDLGRLTIIPGMIDVHAHVGWHFDKDGRYAARPGSPAQEILYSAENAYVTLLAGFTTIQSPGQANDVELREAIGRGVFPGPRILTSIRQLKLCFLTDSHVGMRQQMSQLLERPFFHSLGEQTLGLQQHGVFIQTRIMHPVEPAFARQAPAFHPVANIQTAIHSKLHVRGQHVPNEMFRMHQLEARPFWRQGKGENPAVRRASSEINQKEVSAISRRQPGSRKIRNSGWTAGYIGNGRNNIRRLPIEGRIP
jgi:hypothetical protein